MRVRGVVEGGIGAKEKWVGERESTIEEKEKERKR